MRTKGLFAFALVLLVLALAGSAFGGDNKGEGPPTSGSAPIPKQASSGQETFRIDTHPELDFYQPCNGGDNRLQFPVNISGIDPTTASKATLTMAVWDVDFNCGGGVCERDTVYINGYQLTTPTAFLTGANDQWSTVSFDIPPSFLKEGDNTITVYIDTLSGGWCVSCDWAEIKLDVGPEIEDIEVLEKSGLWSYVALDRPVATKKFYLHAKMKNASGYEIVKVSWVVPDGNSGTGDYRGVTFAGGKHGRKKVEAVVVYRRVGESVQHTTKPKSKEFNVYFRRDKDDQGRLFWWFKPNWFTYWNRDGAVPDLASFGYNWSLGGYGQHVHSVAKGPSGDSYLEIGLSASGNHYGNGYAIPWVTGTVFGGAEGIDCAAEVCRHELQHKFIWDRYWRIVGPWEADGDDDGLPDSYELDPLHASPIDKADSHNLAYYKNPDYATYGDGEWDAMITAKGAKGIVAKDWSDPGKQPQSAVVSALGMLGPAVTVVGSTQGFGSSTLGFVGGYTDSGTDLDGNGLFDVLPVTVGVSVGTDGTYGVVGWLEDALGNPCGLVNRQVFLYAGTSSCRLDFDGIELHRGGFPGPYRLSLILTTEDGDELDNKPDCYTTAAYTVSQFEGEQAYFGPNITDTPVDTNGNGLYEELRFSVDVICTIAGNYEVNAFLMDTNDNPICPLTATLALTPGTSTATLVAAGPTIRQSRLDGPYKLMYLEILDGPKQTDFRYDAYTTGAYGYVQFESGRAEIGPTSSFTDQGIDTNSNTLYDILRVSMPVNVIEGGAYALSGDLYDAADHLICDSYSEMNLAVGQQILNMDFPGTNIFTSGANGPYKVRYTVLYDPGSSVADTLPGHYNTNAYSFTQFEAPGAIALTKQFDDRSIDTVPGGRYEYLDVDVGVVAVQAGTYALNARLADKNGGEICWASTSVYLAAGARRMLTLRFDGNSIYVHGVNGPFHVQDVYIYNTGNTALSDTYAGPYVTKAAWNVGGSEPPTADAGGPYSGTASTPISFDASGSSDPDGTIVSYQWDWNGDGAYDQTTAGPTASHAYPAAFTGHINLKVTDDDGLTDVDSADVVVECEKASIKPLWKLPIGCDGPNSDGFEMKLNAYVIEEKDGSYGDITKAGPISFDIYDYTGKLLRTESANLIAVPNPDPAGPPVAGYGEVKIAQKVGIYCVSVRQQGTNGYYCADPIKVTTLVNCQRVAPVIGGVPQIVDLNPDAKLLYDKVTGTPITDPFSRLQATQRTWTNYMFFATPCGADKPVHLQTVKFEKLIPERKVACGAGWGTTPTTVLQQGIQDIQTRWPVAYEVDGTELKLTVIYTTDQRLAYPSPEFPPNVSSRTHTETFRWIVTSNTWGAFYERLGYFANTPAGTCESLGVTPTARMKIATFTGTDPVYPTITGYGNPALGNYIPGIDQYVRTGKPAEAAARFAALEEYMDLVCADHCGGLYTSGPNIGTPSPVSPGGDAILDNPTAPATSLLFNDLWAVGRKLNVLGGK